MLLKNWYKEWFNSRYYHLLYKNRSTEEAGHFVENLLTHLAPPAGSSMLDVGCGKGRHAIALANAGHEVVGVDLSEASIKYAQQFETERLSFFQHDMRKVFRINFFDYVFNFFTSFGYFQTAHDNQAAARALAANVKKGGTLVIDYLNVHDSLKKLTPYESKRVGELEFEIFRRFEDKQFIKEIVVKDNKGEIDRFAELVNGFEQADFETLFAPFGMQLTGVKGDYQLNEFDAETSPRLILFFTKA